MTAVHMHIEVEEEQAVLAILRVQLATSARSFSLFHETFTRQIIHDRAVHRFEGQGDEAVGGDWQQLSGSRQDIREHNGLVPGDYPINHETSELETWITSNKGKVSINSFGATFSFPGGAPRKPSLKSKYQTAQAGKPAGFPMPDGRGGTKPSPTAAPPRPVVGLDELDMIHTFAALQLWVAGVLAKGTL